MSSLGLSAPDDAIAADGTQRFQIRIARQPPLKTVYQRILKPFPTVMLISGQDSDSNLFVEATLLRSDNELPLPQCMDGNRIVRITNGIFATFKKLKILSTSQQQGTLFRLRFSLKKYAGDQAAFEEIPGCTVVSTPIEVFSHTQYLNEKQESKISTPPHPCCETRLTGTTQRRPASSRGVGSVAPIGTDARGNTNSNTWEQLHKLIQPEGQIRGHARASYFPRSGHADLRHALAHTRAHIS
jgi:hypothetical protein